MNKCFAHRCPITHSNLFPDPLRSETPITMIHPNEFASFYATLFATFSLKLKDDRKGHE